MQENPRVRPTPSSLLTAEAQAKDGERFAQLPIAGVITKPFKAPTLVKQVRDLLQWD
jgi:CheY-like chemotaxis protein